MRNRFTNFGWLITVSLAIIPALIWLFTQPTDWSSAKLIFENLGKLAGLAGISLFAWNVILSARLKIYDKLFLGLDNTYRAHHIIGCITIVLLMIHPMLLTARYLVVSPIAAYEFIKPSLASPYKLLGVITLSVMMLVMFLVLFINVRYKIFIMLQRILGALLFLGGIHAVFAGGSDVGSLLGLQIYIVGLILVAAGVYIYRSIIHKGFHKYHSYRVDQVLLKGDVTEIYMGAVDDPIKHLPGQFAFVKFDTPGVLSESHPFTISAPLQAGKLRFSIKNLGDYTSAVSKLQVGTTAQIDGPYGTFSNQIIKKPRQVWVAGGIGITPFLAMAGALSGDQKVDLYYSTRVKDEAVYLDELEKLAKGKANLSLHPYVAEDQGLLSADYIFKASQNIEHAAFLVCGPPGMMAAIRKQLRQKGVARRNIHTEEFKFK